VTLISHILARRMRMIRPQTLDVTCERDLPAAMDDGAVLLADRWFMASTAGHPQPTVLVRSPYGRRQFVGLLFGRLLAERGLQVVIQSVRGTFGSEGTFTPFDERADGLATLRWLRAQPWHAGPVGTVGPSYLGFVQWAMVGDADPGLAAMSIHVSASEFYGQTYTGGGLSLENVVSWMVLLATQERRLAPVAINRGLVALAALLAEPPLSDLDERATGAAVSWFRDAVANPDRDDPYWAARDHSAAVPSIAAPVQFVGGWYDILLPWMLADFTALQAAGRRPQLLVGPWSHIAPALAAAAERDGVAWMRAHLLGDDRLVRSAPVRLYVTGAGGGWRDYDRWPPPGGADHALYLTPDFGLGETPAGPGPERGPAGDAYRYDPADPTPSLGGPVLLTRQPVIDNAALEARCDVLTYTGPPLAAPLEAIGDVRAELWVTADSAHFDLFARVCDVDSNGVSRNVCDGLAAVAPGGFAPGPDGARRVMVALWPAAHRFAAGHRIRLQVSSGAHPRYARNPGTGADRATATAEQMRPVRIEVLRDAAHPSVLVLPRMG
jgi:hypothetical protein